MDVRNDCGQVSGAPSRVPVQSSERISSPIRPPRIRQAGMVPA